MELKPTTRCCRTVRFRLPPLGSRTLAMLDGASLVPCQPDIRCKFRELWLIEFVAPPIQDPHNGVGKRAAVALQMLERHLGVVPAMVEVQGAQITEASAEIVRQCEFGEVRTPKWRGNQKEAGDRGPGRDFREVLQKN